MGLCSQPRAGGGFGGGGESGQNAWGDCTVSQLGVSVPELRTVGVGTDSELQPK